MNYQILCEQMLAKVEKEHNRLLLHSCCAPCSSYVLVYLRKYFKITVYYYNPNISFEEEYRKRVSEQKRFIEELNKKRIDEYEIDCIDCPFDSTAFFEIARGLETVKEGGERCFLCYDLRLRRTAEFARANQFDYFTTTLSISPLKNAAKLNEIGQNLEKEYGIVYLLSDFKKKNGYKQSIELSKEYDLYRQDYCGCVYSKMEREGEK